MADTITSTTETATSYVNSVQDLLKTSSISAATSLSTPANYAATAYGETTNNFLNSTKTTDTTLGNTNSLSSLTNKVQELSTSATTQLNAFSQSAKNLSGTDGLSYIASLTNKAIDGTGLAELGNFGFSLDSLSTGQFGKIIASAGSGIKDAFAAAKTVSDSVKKVVTAGKQAVNTVLKTVTDTAKAIITPVKSVLSTAAAVTNPNNISKLVQSNLGFLPTSVTNKISSSLASAVSPINKKIQSISSTIAGADKYLTNYSSLDKLTQNLGLSYNAIGTSTGSSISGWSSFTGTSSELTNLIGCMQSTCPSTSNSIPDITQYSNNKDVYDLLVEYSATTKASGPLNALLSTCDAGYNDARTNAILANVIPTVAGNGDISTLDCIVTNQGTGIIANPLETLSTAISNSPYTTETSESLNNLLSAYNLTGNDLVMSDTSTTEIAVVSAEKVTRLSATTTGYIDNFLSQDTRDTVNNVYAAYAGH